MYNPSNQVRYLPIGVHSDIQFLRKVIVHRPDPGIEWVTPSNAESLLYDDIVFLPQMMAQHRVFVEVLKMILGHDSVIEFQNLLEDLLTDPVRREELLQVVVEFERVPRSKAAFLSGLPAMSLASVLISGVVPGIPEPILPPLPNHIFTRDIGVVINGSFLTCLASKHPRMRESILTWFVCHYHPFFHGNGSNNQLIDLCEDPPALLKALANPDLAIEGGDVMLIDAANVFIGCSERTTKQAIREVAKLLFHNGVVERVTMIDIPKLPTCIHLDTLFTQISRRDFVYYQPFLGPEGSYTITQFRGSLEREVPYHTLSQLLIEIEPEVRLIPCGNGQYPYQEREQYASGCNFVALKEGVAVSYARNIKTLEALKAYGYQVMSASYLLEKARKGDLDPTTIKQTIITIPCSELSRAGGGPHCLTLPVVRN